MGDKTIAIDAFEGNNLHLVDEGHRGASGGEEGAWMRFRNVLCAKGFRSNTPPLSGRRLRAAGRSPTPTPRASCSITPNFYADGFGKDYQILNLDEGTQDNHLDAYLVACLLAFFRQQRLFNKQELTSCPFNIDKLLWILVAAAAPRHWRRAMHPTLSKS